MGHQAELDQLRVLGIVVVLLGLDPWVRDRLGLHVQTELGSRSSHELGQIVDGKLLCELVEDSELAGFGWVGYC